MKRDNVALSSTTSLIHILCDQVRVLRGLPARNHPYRPDSVGDRPKTIARKVTNIRELWRGRRQLQRAFKVAA